MFFVIAMIILFALMSCLLSSTAVVGEAVFGKYNRAVETLKEQEAEAKEKEDAETDPIYKPHTNTGVYNVVTRRFE